ncbi:MAG: DNA polymerase III subunit epsilon, partial [Rhodoferax sp.]
MKVDRRMILAIGVIGLASVLWILITIGLIASTLAPEQRALVAEQLAPRFVLIGMTWLFGLFSIAATLRWLFRRYASAPARLLEQTRVLLAAPQAAPMNHQGTKETKALAEAIFQLATQRDTLRADVAAQIAQANFSVQQEKNRLAALMTELTQSVV